MLYNSNMNVNTHQRGARPIIDKEIEAHYSSRHPSVSLDEYTDIWRNWINFSDNKQILGLDKFGFSEYTQGTTQTFDQFAIRHENVTAMQGEFQYHSCIGKHKHFIEQRGIYPIPVNSDEKWGLVHSVPFSDYGVVHPEFNEMLTICETEGTPVCLDFAYWGICKDTIINLNDYPCVKEITFSLSKPFYTLETHRVGIRFSREYLNDGISMLNEVGMNNTHSMALGASYMKKFGPDWNWKKYESKYFDIIGEEDLAPTNTVIFGIGDNARHGHLNRGISDNHRVCISEQLGKL
jgi:hypothetical protein